jgi:ankyrin repeat protein
MQVLQSRGAVLNVVDMEGRRLIHWAAVHGHMHIIEWLLTQGEPVDPQDKEGKTPLIFAAYEGLADMVQYLIRCGASYDACDFEGISALHWSSLQVSVWGRFVRMFINEG